MNKCMSNYSRCILYLLTYIYTHVHITPYIIYNENIVLDTTGTKNKHLLISIIYDDAGSGK